MYPAVAEYTRLLKTSGRLNLKQIMSLEQAEKQVKDILAKGTEEASKTIISSLTRRANLGNHYARKRLEKLIQSVLLQNNIHVKGYSTDELAKRIYAEGYGLSVLQPIYDDPEVEDVFWNRRDRIFKVVDNHVHFCRGVEFKTEEYSLEILKRVTRASTSGEASESNPVNRTVIEDGTRVSWRIPPITPFVGTNLRKHISNKYITEPDFVKRKIISNDVLNVLKALTVSYAAIGIIGSGGTGKTTLLKLLVRILHEYTKPRIYVIERIRELDIVKFLREIGFDDENVIEAEEGDKASLDVLFQNAMQAWVQLLVQGEVLGPEEVANMLNVYRRGHSPGFFTGHAFPKSLPDTLATMYCESKGQNITSVTRSLYEILDGSIYMAQTPKHSRKVVSMWEYYLDEEGIPVSRPFYEYDVENDRDTFSPVHSPVLKQKLHSFKFNPSFKEIYEKLFYLGVLEK